MSNLHQIVSTSYGEVMVVENRLLPGVLECYIGDDFDNYIGEIIGEVNDDSETLCESIENLFN